MAYSNSPLVSYTKLSPNHSGQRTHSIDRITPHCVVGQLSAESICGCFASTSRQASCNYGIGKDGKISLCVEEKNRSWCSSSNANDQRAITIECASDKSEPYAMNSAVYASLIKLCTDICQRNGKGREGTVAFLNGLTGEHCKAFILSITVYSPLKYSVHWFDDTRTKVEMDSNIEDFRNTASYYDGQVMRDNAYRKRFIK